MMPRLAGGFDDTEHVSEKRSIAKVAIYAFPMFAKVTKIHFSSLAKLPCLYMNEGFERRMISKGKVYSELLDWMNRSD